MMGLSELNPEDFISSSAYYAALNIEQERDALKAQLDQAKKENDGLKEGLKIAKIEILSYETIESWRKQPILFIIDNALNVSEAVSVSTEKEEREPRVDFNDEP